MLQNKKGFTLVELIVVMAVFMVVLMITGEAFKTILQQTSRLFRSEESNIEGVVGLEILRHDLQQAGYGLFTEPLCSAYTSEAAAVPASTYNEVDRLVLDPCLPTPSTATVVAKRLPPRAVVAGNNLVAVADTTSETGKTYNILPGTDYLALKGLTLGQNNTSQKWTYLTYAASGVTPKGWVSNSENFVSGDRVLLMKRKVTPSTSTLTIVPEPNNGWFYIPFSNSAFNNFSTNYRDYVAYGLNKTATPTMPFNRADYFVSRPAAANAVPALCAPGIGTLYKATVNQDDGNLTYLPILDCVADMQVVFGWDITIGTTSTLGQDGLIDTWSSPDPASRSGTASLADLQAAMADPELLRSSLKIIKVYILAQDGRKDPGYTSPPTIVVGDRDAGEISLTKNYDIAAAGFQNYRWKVYRVVVRPKNLISNQ